MLSGLLRSHIVKFLPVIRVNRTHRVFLLVQTDRLIMFKVAVQHIGNVHYGSVQLLVEHHQLVRHCNQQHVGLSPRLQVACYVQRIQLGLHFVCINRKVHLLQCRLHIVKQRFHCGTVRGNASLEAKTFLALFASKLEMQICLILDDLLTSNDNNPVAFATSPPSITPDYSDY